jgi:hypothetical protein
MNVNESAAASTKVVGAAAIISRALYRVLTNKHGYIIKKYGSRRKTRSRSFKEYIQNYNY